MKRRADLPKSDASTRSRSASDSSPARTTSRRRSAPAARTATRVRTRRSPHSRWPTSSTGSTPKMRGETRARARALHALYAWEMRIGNDRMKILVIDWQDHRNPQAGGAEIHLHEMFRRVVAAGHRVDLLCSRFGEAPRYAVLEGIAVHRVGTRHSFPFVVHRYYSEKLAGESYDVVIEDVNKIPLYTPLW